MELGETGYRRRLCLRKFLAAAQPQIMYTQRNRVLAPPPPARAGRDAHGLYMGWIHSQIAAGHRMGVQSSTGSTCDRPSTRGMRP